MRSSRRSVSVALTLASLVGALVGGACTSGGTGFVPAEVPTALAVEPTELFGTLACGTAEGSLASYVVTFSDVTSSEAPFVFAVTPALPCALSAEVRDVVAGSLYRADIAAFDRPATTLRVAADGVVTDASGALVEPRWTSACGDAYPTKAVEASRVVMSDCRAFEPVEELPVGPTRVRLDPTGALGALACVDAGGEVAGFELEPASGGGPSFVGLACGAPAVELEPSAGAGPIAYHVRALDAEGEARWGTLCEAVPKPGETVTATCAPLSSVGALELPVVALLEDASLVCGVDLEGVRASLGSLYATGLRPCDHVLGFTGLAPGPYLATLELVHADGSVVASYSCAADVGSGEVAVASCF